jgi:hypothetical protein
MKMGLENRDNLYCKLYVAWSKIEEDLLEFISVHTNGTVDWCSVESSNASYSVLKNDEHDRKLSQRKQDGFLYYPFFVEIEPVESTERKTYLDELIGLLQAFRDVNIAVVAACGFEDELPGAYLEL